MMTKREMIFETFIEALDTYTDEEIDKVVLTINADNGEVLETTVNFAQGVIKY